jgi:hypothetical protein
MMVIFVIGGVLALTGSFDQWTERYRLKRRRRRLLRDKSKVKNIGNVDTYGTPYYSTKPNKETIS